MGNTCCCRRRNNDQEPLLLDEPSLIEKPIVIRSRSTVSTEDMSEEESTVVDSPKRGVDTSGLKKVRPPLTNLEVFLINGLVLSYLGYDDEMKQLL